MTWRLLIHPDLPGYRQMAIDEMLYASAHPDRPTVLRFYTWQRPTLSLGYFQQYKRVVQESFVVHNNIDVVRRITGGRAVLHQYEVTYAVAGALADDFQNQTLQDTYRMIANALNHGLQGIGLNHPLVRDDASRNRSEAGLSQCFVSVSQFEHSLDLRKVIGSAQKRSRDRFLQHGSILLDFDVSLQNGCIRKPDLEIANKIAPLNRELQRSVRLEEVISSFSRAFEEIFQVEIVESELTNEERELAASLEPIYKSAAWTHRGCR